MFAAQTWNNTSHRKLFPLPEGEGQGEGKALVHSRLGIPSFRHSSFDHTFGSQLFRPRRAGALRSGRFVDLSWLLDGSMSRDYYGTEAIMNSEIIIEYCTA